MVAATSSLVLMARCYASGIARSGGGIGWRCDEGMRKAGANLRGWFQLCGSD